MALKKNSAAESADENSAACSDFNSSSLADMKEPNEIQEEP